MTVTMPVRLPCRAPWMFFPMRWDVPSPSWVTCSNLAPTELHYNTGVYASRQGIDVICCIGKLSRNTWEGASAQRRIQGNKNAAYYFETKEEFMSKIDTIIQKGDTVMVKASHSMNFPEIVEKLKTF